MQPGSGRRKHFTASTRALSRVHGFTLIELMVTIAVAAVLITLAIPSFASLINSNRLSAQANEVVASLQLARVEAVRLNQRAVVCRSTNSTSCAGAGQWTGWITFIDKDSDSTVDGGEDIIRVNTVKTPLRVTSGVASIAFRSDGMAHVAGGGLLANDITVCIPTTKPVENQRVVSIGSGGSRISTKSNNGAGACP